MVRIPGLSSFLNLFFFGRTMDVAHNFPHVAFRGLDIGCHLFSTFSELRLMRLKSPLPQDTRFPT
jgi:hypothetical protein